MSQIEEIIGFLANQNPQVRQLAAEALVPLSLSHPQDFRSEKETALTNLCRLILDQPKTAEHALSSLINLSADEAVVRVLLDQDAKFLPRLLACMLHPEDPNADLHAMLLANLAKHPDIHTRLLQIEQPIPDKLAPSSPRVLHQLVDVFVKGMDRAYNPNATFDYLAYVFADLAKHPPVQRFFLTRTAADDHAEAGEYPLTKLKVFTEHPSDIRRRGVANTLKNLAFYLPAHDVLLDEAELNLLPYLLLPLTGNEEYDDEDSASMLPDLQLLPPDKARDSDPTIVQAHIETLTLLTTKRQGRALLRRINVYATIRETHTHVDHEGVREACDRIVQALKRDEAEEPEEAEEEALKKALKKDEDDELVEV